MNKKEFTLLNYINDKHNGLDIKDSEVFLSEVIEDKVIYSSLSNDGFIKDDKLTTKDYEE